MNQKFPVFQIGEPPNSYHRALAFQAMQRDSAALAFFAKQEKERRKTSLVLALANNEALKSLSLLDYLQYCKQRDRMAELVDGATLEYYLFTLLKMLKGDEDILALKQALEKIPTKRQKRKDLFEAYNRNLRRLRFTEPSAESKLK